MTKKIPLAAYLKSNTQTALAEALGMNQSAISKMVRVGRDIYVCLEDGRIWLEEIKRIRGAA